MAVKDLADKAIEVLERDGWCQGFLTNSQGQHCLLGAMNQAHYNDEVGDFHQFYELRQAVSAHIYNGTGDASSITLWNDTPGRTREDVIELLRRAGEDSGND